MRMLTPHLATITRVADQYVDPINGRVRWSDALLAEPDLRTTLLVGDGSDNAKVKRLSNFWLRRKPARAADQAPTTRQGRIGSFTRLLDDNRDALMRIVRDFKKGKHNMVAWTAGLAASPELADALGYSGKPVKEQRRILTLIGFWHRDRNRDGRVLRPKQLAAALPEPAEVATVSHQAAAQLGLRFCPQCGHSLAAQSLATGIVSTLTASGLSNDQIIDTLTRAAATVSRLAKP